MTEPTANQVQFRLERIYLKDLSFENPASPEIFLKNWSPKVNMDIQTRTKKLEGSAHEVVLEIELQAKQDDKPIFLVSLQQAGIFSVEGAADEVLGKVLHTTCPAILFPYAREVVDSCVVKGSLPPMLLSPINFEALYANSKKKDTAAKNSHN